MAKKRKTLPEEMKELLESGDLAALKEQFLRCEPNAITYKKYGSNILALSMRRKTIPLRNISMILPLTVRETDTQSLTKIGTNKRVLIT